MAPRKSLYEVLGIPAQASDPEIREAHQRKTEALRADRSNLSHEDFSYQATLLKLALETLGNPALRRSYDEKLAASAVAPPTTTAPLPPAVPADAEILARRAEALALRADALALRADSISLQADGALPLESAPLSLGTRLVRWARSPLRSVGIIIATLLTVSIISQLFYVRHAVTSKEEAAKAEEQIVIQEYYQTYGVRPASAAEARLLMKEKERQEREERAAEREQQKKEEEARRFKEESRRLGEQVSADLRRAEENKQREEEYKRAQQEEEARRRAEAEEARLERERQRWREVLDR